MMLHLAAEKWGQHEWGRCRSNEFRQIGEKGMQTRLILTDLDRLVPKSPSVKKHFKKCSDPISADPICPFSEGHHGRDGREDRDEAAGAERGALLPVGVLGSHFLSTPSTHDETFHHETCSKGWVAQRPFFDR